DEHRCALERANEQRTVEPLKQTGKVARMNAAQCFDGDCGGFGHGRAIEADRNGWRLYQPTMRRPCMGPLLTMRSNAAASASIGSLRSANRGSPSPMRQDRVSR